MNAETTHVVVNIFALLLFVRALFSIVKHVGRYELAEESPLSVADVVAVLKSLGLSFVVAPLTLLIRSVMTILRLSRRLLQRYINWIFNR